MVRPAQYRDIPRLTELMLEAHAGSKYAGYKPNPKKFKGICMEMMRSGKGCAFVSEVRGVVEGFLIGMTDDLYHILNEQYATDLFFYVSERDGRGGIALLDSFLAWAGSIPAVVTVRLGITDLVGDYDRIAKLYERKGLVREGLMYEMRIER